MTFLHFYPFGFFITAVIFTAIAQEIREGGIDDFVLNGMFGLSAGLIWPFLLSAIFFSFIARLMLGPIRWYLNQR